MKEKIVLSAGDFQQELAEIKKMQKDPDGILTMLTNTCTDLYTVFCC